MKRELFIIFVDGTLSLRLVVQNYERGIPFSLPLRKFSRLYNFNSTFSRH